MKTDFYIQGERTGRRAHDIERQAMEDPLLAEALDGFEAVEGDHSMAIQSLQERVAGSVKRNIAPLAASCNTAHRRFSFMQARAVAAILLLFLCLGGYLVWTQRITPQPTLGTLPAYPELEPWEGSREVIEQNKARQAEARSEMPFGIALY